MAEIVVMPQLGNTVESCIIVTWLVTVGDAVEPNTVLCEVETDKSTMEVEAGVSGTLLARLAEEGDEVPVKDPLAVVGAAGEAIEAVLAGLGAAPAAGRAEPQGAPEGGVPGDVPVAPVIEPVAEPQAGPTAAAAVPGSPASPRARSEAARLGLSLDAVAGTGPHGRIIASDVQTAAASGAGATRAAAASGQYAPGMTGTGIGGRVTREDLAAAPAADLAPVAVPASEAAGFPGAYLDTPLKGVRKLVSDRMMNSLTTSAQLTFNASARAAALQGLRRRLKDSDPDWGLNTVTIGDLVNFAALRTALKYPSINATLEGQVLRSWTDLHLGIAVDTPRGLLVPTVRFASTMGLREFAAASKQVISASLEGRISPDLLAGATFSVTNLGAYGIESFTPILNVPQTAILGVDTIVPRPVINDDGSIGAELRIGFSLTVDHRVVDGADAARYLQDLARATENIDLLVLG